ncbi:MAG: methylated-DNA--protein-cysteine methyltransferase [Lysobacteraceae bacterium]|nr:MAG: methylated-DNA--protein-cysteine methyltransferase [Xanthomonadaceae bacterium]
MSGMSADADPRGRILAVVRAIPRGRVMGYGEVARRAGLPRGARRVARLLAEAGDPDLPWHRVVRADRRIAFPPGSPGFSEQRRRLQDEGHVVDGRGRLRSVERVGGPDLDRALWS